MKLIDTSVAIDHLRGYEHATALIENLLRSGATLVASEVTRFELLAGVRPEEQEFLESFFLAADLLTINVRHFPMFEGLQSPYRY